MFEDDPLRDVFARGRWAYAASKLACERRLDAARDLWPRESRPVHLRFFNVVGPGQDASSGMMLPTFIEQALAGLPLTVHGDGCQMRTLAHVDEVAETLCALIARAGVPGGPLNIGGCARASVLDIAREVERSAGVELGIEFVDPRASLGLEFEPVAWREPALGALARIGVPLPSSSLVEIVRDTWRRHAALVQSMRTVVPLERNVACASLASSRA